MPSHSAVPATVISDTAQLYDINVHADFSPEVTVEQFQAGTPFPHTRVRQLSVEPLHSHYAWNAPPDIKLVLYGIRAAFNEKANTPDRMQKKDSTTDLLVVISQLLEDDRAAQADGHLLLLPHLRAKVLLKLIDNDDTSLDLARAIRITESENPMEKLPLAFR
ncbi:hypothetical protein CYMTET_27081 [Cymbomonas tetramitiformis]|uniref:Uncharacterized protein n=1 Tax=Cymbomonas tetramitiformis TaxID=36881 RepID=A0AAE0EPH6_9CHLO|nr:hypothetical protein CYMTET_54293 [Cymbomonas tetramitiformis]KAK3264156.1 hypothetical protein CYMTET_27081 [Cymbomonas tetramitiformis]